MTVTPAGIGLLIVCATNVGALIYNTAAVNTRLSALEYTLNDGMADTVKLHGEAIAAIQARQEKGQ